MLKEFKEFAVKGNMLDLAVALILGIAFGAIVTSLVKDIVMPPIGLALGHIDFKNLMIVLKDGNPIGPYATPDAASAAKAVTINYGNFINLLINFLVVSLVVFFLVKAMNKLKKKEEAAPVVEPEPTKEEILLTEIRDLLKKG
ncbi:MAG TPA: large-conductance mechanosensitive channel protein MscL [Fimbriimonadaceae bacterium]|jgi:large conductance mechanosensitive channel